MIMTRQQRKTIEHEFRNYTKNRQQAAEYVASQAFSHFGVDYSSERVKSSSGNYAEQKIIRVIDEADKMWRWCLVFEKTIEHFRWEKKDKVMRMKYIERKKTFEICQAVSVSRSEYFYWLNHILEIAYNWACDLKLF